jgi:Domain of unknown function (DUF4157)
MDFEAFRARMERAYEADFATVELDSSGVAESATRSIGAIAAARAQTIFLSESFFALPPKRQEFILAHEFAHVVQKRAVKNAHRPGFPDRMWATSIEADADCAAVDALAGRRAICGFNDSLERLAGWNEAGHYYTSLYIMLAAGVNKKVALRRAFFCQMPDQVFDFDATSAGIDYYEGRGGLPHIGLPKTTYYPAHEHLRTQRVLELDSEVELPKDRYEREREDQEIQYGLHCITSHDGESESRYREKQMEITLDDDVSFGLALHAYGDSFAHRDADGKLPSFPEGHILDTLNRHDPDHIFIHRTIYSDYIFCLYVFMTVHTNQTYRLGIKDTLDELKPLYHLDCEGDEKRRKGVFCKSLIDVQKAHDEAFYCNKIKNLIFGHGWCSPGDEFFFEPEKDMHDYWRNWAGAHKRFFPTEDSKMIYDKVRARSRDWYNGSAK